MQPSLRRILVVEDDRSIRALLGCLLRREFEVETSPDGMQGLDRGLAGDFDAVITDVRMPVLDGIAMVQALRRAGRALPVVFLTGSPGDLGPARLAALGPARLVTKPCDLRRLRAVLAELGL
jgi:CheY-like chemotaxis protein